MDNQSDALTLQEVYQLIGERDIMILRLNNTLDSYAATLSDRDNQIKQLNTTIVALQEKMTTLQEAETPTKQKDEKKS